MFERMTLFPETVLNIFEFQVEIAVMGGVILISNHLIEPAIMISKENVVMFLPRRLIHQVHRLITLSIPLLPSTVSLNLAVYLAVPVLK